MRIERLSQENLAGTIELAHKVFPYEASSDNPPGLFLRASLNPKENKELLKKHGIRKLEYFVLLDNKRKRVIGLIGQYETYEDLSDDIVWLGWFCIDPDFQGQKLGESLLIWNMQNAREKGYKTMKLYTSDDRSEKYAQKLYNKLGFKINKVQPVNGEEYNLLYRERRLPEMHESLFSSDNLEAVQELREAQPVFNRVIELVSENPHWQRSTVFSPKCVIISRGG